MTWTVLTMVVLIAPWFATGIGEEAGISNTVNGDPSKNEYIANYNEMERTLHTCAVPSNNMFVRPGRQQNSEFDLFCYHQASKDPLSQYLCEHYKFLVETYYGQYCGDPNRQPMDTTTQYQLMLQTPSFPCKKLVETVAQQVQPGVNKRVFSSIDECEAVCHQSLFCTNLAYLLFIRARSAVSIWFAYTGSATITEGDTLTRQVCYDHSSVTTSNTVNFSLSAFPGTTGLTLPTGSLTPFVGSACVSFTIESTDNGVREDTKAFRISLSSSNAYVNDRQDYFILNVQDNDSTSGNSSSCPTPTIINSSQLSCNDSFSIFSVCSYNCSRGFELLSGDTSRTCTGSLRWSGRPLFCRIPIGNTRPFRPNCSHISVTCGGSSTAVATYDPIYCKDAQQGSIPAVCFPASGSQFRAGGIDDNMVSCTCTDDGGLQNKCDFWVNVEVDSSWNPCWALSCQNGGTCVESNYTSYKEPRTANCSCPDGYKGKYCENVDHSWKPCSQLSCENGGTCVERFTSYNKPRVADCVCPEWFEGKYCQYGIGEGEDAFRPDEVGLIFEDQDWTYQRETEEPGSHFFVFLVVSIVLIIFMYIVYHNKRKIKEYFGDLQAERKARKTTRKVNYNVYIRLEERP